MWVSRFYLVDAIMPIAQKVFAGWDIVLDSSTIRIGRGQESLIITNDIEWAKTLPDWIQVKVWW